MGFTIQPFKVGKKNPMKNIPEGSRSGEAMADVISMEAKRDLPSAVASAYERAVLSIGGSGTRPERIPIQLRADPYPDIARESLGLSGFKHQTRLPAFEGKIRGVGGGADGMEQGVPMHALPHKLKCYPGDFRNMNVKYIKKVRTGHRFTFLNFSLREALPSTDIHLYASIKSS